MCGSRTTPLFLSPAVLFALPALLFCAGCSSPDTTATSPREPHHGAGSHFASVDGVASGDGTSDRPWDLATALSGASARVVAGDTIWLRGGTYSGTFGSSLTGTAGNPIVVRQYPGERATIDGSITVNGRYAWYWGFEVANSDTGTRNVMGLDSHCPGCRFINLEIHDHSGNGLGMWSEGPDQEAYGNVIYANGFRGQDAGHNAHGIYGQNRIGTQRILDNIIFGQFGYGLHIYGSDAATLDNFVIDGNTAFDNGLGGQLGMSGGMDYQVGGDTPLHDLVFTHNFSYRSPSLRGDYTARLGYDWGPLNEGATFTDNYFVGKLLVVQWGALDSSRNVVIGRATPALTRVIVQPNEYERGRANVIVYNWAHEGSAAVDLSEVLAPGDSYEIRDVRDFHGTPVASGVYTGGPIQLPLGHAGSAHSITGTAIAATGIEFGAFVVLPR